jgi:hypothetical protein
VRVDTSPRFPGTASPACCDSTTGGVCGCGPRGALRSVVLRCACVGEGTRVSRYLAVTRNVALFYVFTIPIVIRRVAR